MSSDRAHPVRYSLKGTSQPKIRPLNSSTRSSGDLFDKLKSSVASKSAAPSSSMPKPTFKDPVESENYERKSANYSFKYTYSHSPRYAGWLHVLVDATTKHTVIRFIMVKGHQINL